MNMVKSVIHGATAMTFAVGGGATGAVIANGDVVTSGVIHACYITKATPSGAHAVVLQNSSTRCPSGSSAIRWNEQGPAGPRGPSGATGHSGIISVAQYQEVTPPIVTGSDWEFLGSPVKEDFTDAHTTATVIYSDGGVTFLNENGTQGDIGVCYEPVSSSTLTNVVVPGINTPTALFSGLTPGAYYIGPCAKNQSLVTNNTDVMTIIMGETSVAEPHGGTAPPAPRNLTASQVPGAVTITWDAPTSDGGSLITSYKAVDNGMTVTDPPDLTSATFNDLSVTINAGKTELFQVEANKYGSSWASIEVKLIGGSG
jgi:hypothetical protein